ncbi:MAG: hypothetical protein PHQ67_04850, partial [Fermentimonas sp.]|nr:hypothetical protein [Fermentimonas sp.]
HLSLKQSVFWSLKIDLYMATHLGSSLGAEKKAFEFSMGLWIFLILLVLLMLTYLLKFKWLQETVIS